MKWAEGGKMADDTGIMILLVFDFITGMINIFKDTYNWQLILIFCPVF